LLRMGPTMSSNFPGTLLSNIFKTSLSPDTTVPARDAVHRDFDSARSRIL